MSGPPRRLTRRRTALLAATVPLTSLSGCLTDDSADGARAETALQLDEASPVGVSNEFSTPIDAVGHAGRTAVRTAVDGGEATVEGYYAPGVSAPYVVTDSPAYYRVETETVRSVAAPGYDYTVEVDSVDSFLLDPPSSVSFADLPEHDRDAVRDALGNASLIHAPHYPPFEVTFAYASAERRERSLFVPENDGQRVEWDGELLRFAFEGERSVDVATVAVRADRVASSQREFRRVVGEERGRSIGDPTADQRAILDEAVDSEYAESPPHSEAFATVLDALSADGEVVPLVRYDGSWYFTHLSRPD
ncbi:hypothetical protein C470_01383 [Halorubrum distributum JCM 13561]|uniref:Uncharacterized protein n=3 Tax=Halorubrum distributum TaxID=29283 RepID=M0P237_9EURY|nr:MULTISPECIES: hypothetical protein [Halorubrum distributum group]ELZ34721.1 hypothetical protein C473_05080 [Halorubrum terrestre JCM 10247]EMA64212.1 hypothetical protein C470_01383 [Halorubrum litoreum JCM 13561]EMA72294.1 hypothetical protein C462_01877 [Halorubrum arcis JCM 13916]